MTHTFTFTQRITFIILLFAGLTTSLPGQITKADYYNKIDNRIFLLSKNKELAFDSIVSFVKHTYPKNEDRVRAYYTWIALNISYDSDRLKAMEQDKNLFARKDSSQEATIVFGKKKAVCEGFAKLMNKFCGASDIPSQMVIGYTKMPGGEVMTDILHAWNAVKIDDSWKLLDVTWSNGYVGFYGYHKQFSDKYFIENTDRFCTDHLPLDPQWQLSAHPLSKNYFFRIDTTNKYFTSAVFNYVDSISAYKQQNSDKQQWLDYVHYYNYDKQAVYLNNADYFIYENAVFMLNDAALDFQEYQLFYTSTLSKSNTGANCKKAKALLDVSKKKHTEMLAYLTGKKAFSKEIDSDLTLLRTKANENLVLISKHAAFIAQLQKSAPASKGKS